jgi:hypothetical protein
MKYMLRAIVIAATSMLLASCATVGSTTTLNTGDWVLARWQEDRTYYWPAIVSSRSGDMVTLQYDDGDVGTQHVGNVRAFDWGPGTRVECRWQDGPTFHPGRIATMEPDRYRIFVHYDDGDQEATDTSRCRGF